MRGTRRDRETEGGRVGERVEVRKKVTGEVERGGLRGTDGRE